MIHAEWCHHWFVSDPKAQPGGAGALLVLSPNVQFSLFMSQEKVFWIQLTQQNETKLTLTLNLRLGTFENYMYFHSKYTDPLSSEKLQVNQREGIGPAQSSWPINSPWIQTAAVELTKKETHMSEAHEAETELRWAELK